jgi:hypothetical protein
VIPQFFDGVTPPALPPGWSSTTWVTSNAGLPSPPAYSLPNAGFVDDPATINDKQLLSPSIPVIADGTPARMSFRSNFNLQDGFDGGVLKISFDDGLTFQDILAAGGTFTSGGYNGTISTLLWQSPRGPSGVDWKLRRVYRHYGKSPVLITPHYPPLENVKR